MLVLYLKGITIKLKILNKSYKLFLKMQEGKIVCCKDKTYSMMVVSSGKSMQWSVITGYALYKIGL